MVLNLFSNGNKEVLSKPINSKPKDL